MDNHKFFYTKNSNLRMKPASTTKILTALIALEHAQIKDKKVRFTEDMIAEGSSMYLGVGDMLRLSDLVAGLMMCSGNDAANAIALSIAGSKKKFAKLMNERVRKIGLKDTHFVTPSGLDDDSHYTTAHDMALIMNEAMKNERFRFVSSQKSMTVHFIKPAEKVVTYSNHNRLLSSYQYCTGGKTGYTMAAGRCLVTTAQKDDMRLIAVTFNDRNDWKDHAALYDYGFTNFETVLLNDKDTYFDLKTFDGEKEATTVGGSSETKLVLKKGERRKIKRKIRLPNLLYAPLKLGDRVGEIKYILNGKAVAKHKITVSENNNSVLENKSLWDIIKGFFR